MALSSIGNIGGLNQLGGGLGAGGPQQILQRLLQSLAGGSHGGGCGGGCCGGGCSGGGCSGCAQCAHGRNAGLLGLG